MPAKLNQPHELTEAIDKYPSWKVGQTIRICHEECSAHKPNPLAMAVIKKNDGYWFFCFRCGYKGFSGHQLKSPSEMREQLKQLEECKAYESFNTIRLPHDCLIMTSNRPKDIPWKAYQWCWNHDIDGDTIEKYEFQWSPSWNRVIIPIYEWTSKIQHKVLVRKLIGWVGREVDYNNKKQRAAAGVAKYITHKSSEYKRIFFHAPIANNNTYVLVEDVLSAIKVRECAKVNAIALLTTSIPTRVLVKMRKRNLIVWLDFDVLSSTLKYFSKSRRWGGSCRYLRTRQDPKYYSGREIRDKIASDHCDWAAEQEKEEEKSTVKKPWICIKCNLKYFTNELLNGKCPMCGDQARTAERTFFCAGCGNVIYESEIDPGDSCPVCNRGIDNTMLMAG